MFEEVEGWDKEMREGREVRKGRSVRFRGEGSRSREGCEESCCTAGDET